MSHPLLKDCMFDGLATQVPNVFSLQQWLEHAWQKGIDTDGAAQLGGSVYGTNKWIGATDVAACLRGMRVPAQVLDFHADDDPSLPLLIKHHTQLSFYDPLSHRVTKGLPRSAAALPSTASSTTISAAHKSSARHSGLVSFVWNHFTRSSEHSSQAGSVTGADASAPMPLYLQHDGHSRTVVGIERRRRTRGALRLSPNAGTAAASAGGGAAQGTLSFPTAQSAAGAAALRRAEHAAAASAESSKAVASATTVDLSLSQSSQDSDSDVEIIAESPARTRPIHPDPGAVGGAAPARALPTGATMAGSGAGQAQDQDPPLSPQPSPELRAQDVFDLSAEEVFLLVLDPATLSRKYESALGLRRSGTASSQSQQASGWERFVKRGLHTLRHPQYQVVFVDPAMGPIPDQEQAHWNTMHGIKVLPLHVLRQAAREVYGAQG